MKLPIISFFLFSYVLILSSCNSSNNLLGSGDGKAKGDNAPTVFAGNDSFTVSIPPTVGLTAQVSGSCTAGADVTFSTPDLSPNPQTIMCSSSGEYNTLLNFSSGIDKVASIDVKSGNLMETLVVSVDTVKPADPTIVFPANNAVISDLSQVITGVCESGDTVFVTGDIDPSPVGAICSGNSYSIAVSVVDISGPKLISVYEEDKAGNRSNTVDSNIILDTNLPLVAITSAETINSANVTNYGVTGSCSEDGRNVSVSLGGVTPAPVLCSSGLWSITGIDLSGASDASNFIITADHNDVGGNNAVQAIANVKKDTAAPLAPIVISPAPGSSLLSANTTVVGGNCEEGDIVSVAGNINPSPQMTTCSGGQYSIPVVLIPGDGVKNLTVSQEDQAGNVSSSTNFSTTLDQTPPIGLTITAPANGSTTNSHGQVITGACETGSTVTLSGDFTPNPAMVVCSASSYSLPVNLISGDGAKNIQAIQRDSAGNASPSIASTVSLDTSKPTVTITTPIDLINNPNSTAYGVYGTCSENGQAVKIIIGGINVAPQPNCVNGVWATGGVDLSSLGDSSAIVVQVDHNDFAGNSAVQQLATTSKDTVAPNAVVILSPTNNENINSLTMNINGTCEPNSTVILTGDFTPSPSEVTCSGGNYASTVTASSGDGVKNISIIQKDPNGNLSVATAINVNLDTGLPADPTISAPVGVINTKMQTVTGTCETGSTVSLTGDIASSPVTGTCAGSSYSIAVEFLAPDSVKNLSVSQDDTSGNTSNTVSTSVTLDTMIPTVSITNHSSINDTNKTSYSLSGLCSEETRNVVVSVGGVTPAVQPICSSNMWSITGLDVSGVADNTSLLITADHDDSAANNAVQATANIIKDVVTPTNLTIVNPAGSTTTNSNALSINGVCETGASVSLTGDFTPSPRVVDCVSSAYSTSVVLSSGDGVKNINATQTDVAGNVSAIVSSSITLDTGVPTVTISTPLSNINSMNQSTYSFSGTCSEETRTVTIDIGGVSPAVQPICSSGSWSVSNLDVSGVADNATISIHATHDDMTGNLGSALENTAKDSTAPMGLTIASPANSAFTNNTTQSIEGVCESGSTVTLSGDFTPTPVQVSCVAASYSQTVVLASGDGAKNITASETDSFGNMSTNVMIAINLDTVTPVGLTITAPANGSGVNSIIQTVTGACEANSQITLTGSISPSPVNGTCTGGGTYSIPSVVLTSGDGVKTINSTQTDQAGNVSAVVSSLVTLDTSTPNAITVTSPANGAVVGVTAQVIIGTCESGLTVSLLGDITPSPVTGVCTNGAFSINVNLTSSGGSKIISGTQSDIAGNTSPTTNLVINYDTSQPLITSTALTTTDGDSDGWYENGDTIAIQVVYDKIVNVVGSPEVPLILTSGTKTLSYASGSGTNVLNFSGTITTGDYSCASSHSLGSLNLNGGTIKSIATIDANNSALSGTINGFMVDAKSPSGSFGVLDISADDPSVDRSPTTTWSSQPTDECGISDYSFSIGTHDGVSCNAPMAIASFESIGIVSTFQAISGTAPFDMNTFSISSAEYCTSVRASDLAGNIAGLTSSAKWDLAGIRIINGAYEKYPGISLASCQEYLDDPVYNNTGDGIYRIDPDGPSNNTVLPFKVYCDMDGSDGWTLLASAIAGDASTPIVNDLTSTSSNGILSELAVAAIGSSINTLRVNSLPGTGSVNVLEVKSSDAGVLSRLASYETLSDVSPPCNTSLWSGSGTSRLGCTCGTNIARRLNLNIYHACGVFNNFHWISSSDLSSWGALTNFDNMNLWVK